MSKPKTITEKYEMLKHVIEYKTNEAWVDVQDAQSNLEHAKEVKNEEQIKTWEGILENCTTRWAAFNTILKAVYLSK